LEQDREEDTDEVPEAVLDVLLMISSSSVAVGVVSKLMEEEVAPAAFIILIVHLEHAV
jgi:hypothetical protein